MMEHLNKRPRATGDFCLSSWLLFTMEHLGHQAVNDTLISAIEEVLRKGRSLTPDMGGAASTRKMGSAIAEAIKKADMTTASA